MERQEGPILNTSSFPPHKKQRLDVPWTARQDKEEEEAVWYANMEKFREQQLSLALYDNALNFLIEKTGVMGNNAIEDEAVTMAIRSHGLARPIHLALEVEGSSVFNLPRTSTDTFNSFGGSFDPFESTFGPCDAFNNDVLAQAISTAIMKKGLGAMDR